ncbi:UDP-4-amino-4-deoxy-L-arabinose--oxoglutarate aminotransferase [Candidatus Bilamarchaeum dharawalense]|uniref:UDP-4-amino-4-deoxy-L-arabinose--oxoglutarate aminotransferase n=1 Tax=Candidatus Bilamarchaeum dharawalense TaxID=2885759 RepID=A0A5E4LQ11_9ARCH|nr:UDP-4-amino-4-deoxy-L-arabinose--oxoglutarate aminotransferase [Candidatus Bilamarchaeum dharawalense]
MTIYLDRPIISQEMIDAAVYSLQNEYPLFGESIAKFEEEFARYCGTNYAISVGSGSDALMISLIAISVKGKHVLTTPMSYVATANTSFHAGATPFFADVQENGNINPKEIGKKLKKDKKIKAIVPVHLHGYPAEMAEIMELACKKEIAIIEDACQAHGAKYFGKRAGSMGLIGCFSFNPVKNMSVGGTAGMVVTNDEKLANKIKMLADAGRKDVYSHEHELIGFSSRINSVNAAIGRIQLRELDGWNEKRRGMAEEYRKRLSEIEWLQTPDCDENIEPVYNKFAIRTARREELREFFSNNDIQSDGHYKIPIHLHPPYRKMGYKKGDFPMAEKFADTILSLPLHPNITLEEIEEVCSKINEFGINKK